MAVRFDLKVYPNVAGGPGYAMQISESIFSPPVVDPVHCGASLEAQGTQNGIFFLAGPDGVMVEMMGGSGYYLNFVKKEESRCLVQQNLEDYL